MAGLKSARLLLSFAGADLIVAILRYTLELRRLDQAYEKERGKSAASDARSPGRLIEVAAMERGARFIFENAGLEVVFLAADLARLTWEPGKLPVSYAIDRQEWPPLPVKMEQIDGGFSLQSSDLCISLLADGVLEFTRLSEPGACLLRRADPPHFCIFNSGPAWTDTAGLEPEERLFGLGASAGGLDLSGRQLSFWNNDPAGSYGPGKNPLYMLLPVYMGLHRRGSYLVFYENSFEGSFSASPPALNVGRAVSLTQRKTSVSFNGGALRYYFLAGEPAQLLDRFTELTGRPALPPRWSMGYHQSRWGYKTEADIRQVVAGFQQRRMPLSAIHLDIDYMDGFRVFSVDRRRFPDLKRIADELEAQGIRLVTIVDPGVKRDPRYDVYAEGSRQGLFCALPTGDNRQGSREFHAPVWPGWSAFPDFTLPEARHWWAGLYPRLLDLGVGGIWHDMNEPTAFTFDSQMSLPRALIHNLDGRVGEHSEARNLYGLQMNRAAYEGLQQARPQRRPWIVSRSGWVSQQRYAWNWTGDVESTWPALRMTIATVIGSGLSGLPFNGPDIGGFSGNPAAELYLRWFQTACFLPFCRTHSALNVKCREPWTCGEPYTSIISDYLRLRYRLLPYLYTLAWQAFQTGAPLVRPLLWTDPADELLWPVDDEFLLGDALLVAPFLEPGQTRRRVTLPAGEWVDYWADTIYTGPEIEIDGSLERIPLLVKTGSLLPMEQDGVLTLHLFAPPAPGSPPVVSTLYADAGDGYGPWRVDRFTVQMDGGGINIHHEKEGGFVPNYSAVQFILHNGKTYSLRFNDHELQLSNIHSADLQIF